MLWSTVASAAGLLLLMGASIATDRKLFTLPQDGALRVQVTAHQWWWEIRVDDDDPSKSFTTANELTIPVGRPVLVTLAADDVIHSFWVPNLHGKLDLIPGRTATTKFRADREGLYRGQCAEFCGLQHARMAFQVQAVSPEAWTAWADAQRSVPPEPTDARLVRGRDAFVRGACAMCHSVQGTPAQGRRAPDLTHLASRRTLAAGTLENNDLLLARWIADPQSFKPGTNMPATPMPEDDLLAIVAWLDTLK